MAKKKKVNVEDDDLSVKHQASYMKEEEYENKKLKYKISLKCKNEKQKELVKTIKNNDIVFVEGVFGVGKTFVINSLALSMLKDKEEIKKIILIVPTVETGDMHLGLMPGDLSQKLEGHCVNEIDSLIKILNKSGNLKANNIVDDLIKDGFLEVRPISYLRGASLENAFICVSEAEEFTKEELFLIISRFESGKMVVSGDPLQSSRKIVKAGNSGLLHAVDRLKGVKGVGIVKFDEEDIVRNDILLEIYKKWKD